MDNLFAYHGDKPYIFISYSHKDTDIVMRMVSQMTNDGYRLWFDEGINPGTEWSEFIAKKISKSGLFMAFISENYLESDNCKDELNYSRDHVENVLLIYLSNVSLPSGMELRFGRKQSIPAYNYSSKEEFFNKLYSSYGISDFLEPAIEEIPISEMPVSDTPASTLDKSSATNHILVPVYPTSASAAPSPVNPTSAPANPSPVKSKEAPVIKAPVRVVSKPKKNTNKPLIIGIVASTLLTVLFLILIFTLPDKSAEKKKTTRETEADIDELFTSEAGDTSESIDYVSPSSTDTTSEPAETAAQTAAVVETETTAESTTESTTEATTEATYSNPFEPYGLSTGASYYSGDFPDFYNNTGAVYTGYAEDAHYEGTFYNTDTMSIRIPALNDYSESVNIYWYYIRSDGSVQDVFTDYYVTPTMVNDEMNYTSIINGSLFDTGHFPVGTYYVTVDNGVNLNQMVITRLFYSDASYS